MILYILYQQCDGPYICLYKGSLDLMQLKACLLGMLMLSMVFMHRPLIRAAKVMVRIELTKEHFAEWNPVRSRIIFLSFLDVI